MTAAILYCFECIMIGKLLKIDPKIFKTIFTGLDLVCDCCTTTAHLSLNRGFQVDCPFFVLFITSCIIHEYVNNNTVHINGNVHNFITG